ncbi:type II secretion system protein [Spiribacter vilamensis]|nr:type II secretion system protein [Spiribacter vilamensis]
MTGHSGFTLIELVVVLIILGVLAGVAVPRFSDLTDRVGLAEVQTQARAIQTYNRINVLKCQSNGLRCTNLTETGTDNGGACKRNADDFFLSEDLSGWEEKYGIETIESTNKTEEERRKRMEELINNDNKNVTSEAALFTLTRYADRENPNEFPRELPCAIYKRK